MNQSRRQGLLAFVREALAGTEQDFTQGSIGRAVALLAIPMVLEMSMESLFGFVDAIFVTQLGKEAVATVGMTEAVLTLIFGVALGLSLSTTAMVARRVGEKDDEGAAVAAVQSILLGVVVSVLTGIIGVMDSERILRMMGADEEMVRRGAIYTATILGGSVTIFLLFLLNAIFRGAGDASMAMRSLMVSNTINLILDPCLIFGLGPFPELGLWGASIATTIGRGTGVAFQLYILMTGKGRLHLHWRQFRLVPSVMWSLIRVSITGILQIQIATASWLGMIRILATFGSAVLAGTTIAIRTIVVVILPAWGMSNAAATLVGQNLGAGKPDRAERSVWITGFYNMIFLGVIGLVFIIWPEQVLSIYQPEASMVPFGVACLRYVSYGYLFYAYGMVVVQAFNGAGDTVTPTYINLFCHWLWQIPLAWGLSTPLGMGPTGVFLAITIAESTVAAVGILLFRRGKWKQQKI
ncbi:MAG: MATE family efflux transporter [Acidimicrobiia bacterium]|nr:MATE family efflux transporter [Acidimicrobiia bacterium]